MKVRAAGLSDVGRCRSTNQDQFLVDHAMGLYAVADGMGGHAAGEVASDMAIGVLSKILHEDDALPRQGPDEAAGKLRQAMLEGNRRIVESMKTRLEWRGMGTTLVAMLVVEETAIVAHVGDSRAYLFRDGALRRLTGDHSWVHEQVRAGLLTEEEAGRHPMRHIVTRALGNLPEVDVELLREPVRPGDVIALCSDGLNGMLSDAQIETTLAEHGQVPQAACRALVDRANAQGGEDNITVVVFTRDA